MDLFYFYDSCDESRTVYLVYLLVNITSGYKLALLKIAPDDWKACTAVCIEVVEIQNDFKYYHITKYTEAMWRTLSQMKNSGKPGNTRYWGNPPYGLGDDKCFFLIWQYNCYHQYCYFYPFLLPNKGASITVPLVDWGLVLVKTSQQNSSTTVGVER